MEITNDEVRCELIGKKGKKQDDEDQRQPEEQLGPQLVTATAASHDCSKSNSRFLLPVGSCSDQGQGENVMAVAAAAAAVGMLMNPAAALGRGGGSALPNRRFWWGDCQPHVVLLRQALLSSAPDIAVLGPLHGCFAFYMTHLHNEVLSSTYAKTMTFGANATRLESAFMWVGGWRPTSALVLVYSLMGIDIENAFEAVRIGREVLDSFTSSMLSARQLAVMQSLQKHTQHAEMKISKKLTVLQMLVGDQDMLEAVLRDAASPVANDSSRFNQVAGKRMSRFRRLLVQAEELRLHTLKDLLSLLTPIQAAKCGVAVFEICSSLRTMGSTLPPPLPAVTVVVASSGAIPSSSPVDQPVVDGNGELVASSYDLDLPSGGDASSGDEMATGDDDNKGNSSSRPISLPDETLISDLSTSDNSMLNSSNGPLSQSYEPLVSDVSSSSSILHDSDVQLSPSDETARLVPSCSNSSSSQLLTQNSSRALKKDQKSRSWPTLLPLADVSLCDVPDGADPSTSATSDCPGAVEKEPEGGKIISSRLLLLSPATSDVVIQDCSLDSAELPFFELEAQLSLPSDDTQTESGESDAVGGPCQIQPGRMPAPWLWSSPKSVKCSLHQKYAVWTHGWMDIWWRKNAIEIM